MLHEQGRDRFDHVTLNSAGRAGAADAGDQRPFSSLSLPVAFNRLHGGPMCRGRSRHLGVSINGAWGGASFGLYVLLLSGITLCNFPPLTPPPAPPPPPGQNCQS